MGNGIPPGLVASLIRDELICDMVASRTLHYAGDMSDESSKPEKDPRPQDGATSVSRSGKETQWRNITLFPHHITSKDYKEWLPLIARSVGDERSASCLLYS